MPASARATDRSMTVTLGGRPYPLRVTEDDEGPIRRIASELNDKINELQRSYPDRDRQDVLGMLLLIYAVDLYKVKGGERVTAAMPSAQDATEISDALRNAEQVLTRALEAVAAPYSALSVEE